MLGGCLRRRGVGFEFRIGLGHQDTDHPQGGDQQGEHAAGGLRVAGAMARVSERSGDGPKAIVRGNDLPDVISSGAELNEGHGHGGGVLAKRVAPEGGCAVMS